MRIPGILWADELATSVQRRLSSGKYTPARPEPYYSIFQRWRAAWLVFTGKADALRWTDQ